jgi:hypothetical protein
MNRAYDYIAIALSNIYTYINRVLLDHKVGGENVRLKFVRDFK